MANLDNPISSHEKPANSATLVATGSYSAGTGVEWYYTIGDGGQLYFMQAGTTSGNRVYNGSGSDEWVVHWNIDGGGTIRYEIYRT